MTARTQLRNHLKACLRAAEDMCDENCYPRKTLFAVRAWITNAIEALDSMQDKGDVDYDVD